jgi:hypothetical protein
MATNDNINDPKSSYDVLNHYIVFDEWRYHKIKKK